MTTASGASHPASELAEVWGLTAGNDQGLTLLVEAYGKLGRDPVSAARIAEQSFASLAERDDLWPWLALVVSVSGRIQSLSDFHGLDPLIAFFDQHRDTLRAPDPVSDRIDACIFGCLVFRRPDHPKIADWADRCEQLVERGGGPGRDGVDPLARLSAANYLILYRIWCGDLIGAEVLASRAAALRDRSPDVHARLLCHSINSMILRLFLRYEECRREIKQGLVLARESGVHIWDSHFHMQGAFLALTRENLAEAREWLEQMAGSASPEHFLDRSGYHYCRGWLHTLQDEMPLAIRHARESVELARRSGAVFPQAITHVGLAQLHLEQKNMGSGLYHLLQARRIGRRMEAGGLPVTFIRGLLTAHLSFRVGMEQRGYRALAQAFRIGREQHYLNFPWWRADLVAGLCARALDGDVEPGYARTLIRLRRLRPPETLKRRDRWYFPLQVDVLAAGRVRMDGEEVQLGRQSLSLLTALCCLGDDSGWVEREHLSAVLWPDSSLERAQQALDTAVHRLRRRLGTERLIRGRSGALGLDPGFCRVDYWQLRRVLHRETPQPGDLAFLADSLACCSALGNQTVVSLISIDALREQIIGKALAIARNSGLSSADQLPWLERLLQASPLSEQLWQALIRHHVERGMMHDALAAWERCCQAFRQEAAGEPSPALRVLIGRAGSA